jgi:RNA ligase (TIGR02306 family)
MSSFACNVVRVAIEPHPNADAIELARVGGYVSIVKKGQFKTGDLAVYLPEQSVLPEWMLKQLGFWDDLNAKGKLSGSAGNRVKAMKLRGILSQGILLEGVLIPENDPAIDDGPAVSLCVGGANVSDDIHGEVTPVRFFKEDDDAAEFLGIVKYEPKVPQNMAGKVAGGDLDCTIAYDFDSLKKNPNLFEPGQEVVITEKIHGTLLQVGIIPERLWAGKSWADKVARVGDHGFRCIVTSKGQGARGYILDMSDAENLYVKTALDLLLHARLEFIRQEVLGHPNDMPLFMFGEVFGIGVQDLGYGFEKPTFRAFDIYAGVRGNGFFLNQQLFDQAVTRTAIDSVPVLYRGPFDPAVVAMHTDGITTVGNTKQIREGVVVKATSTVPHPRYGRRIAKSVSEAYLLRKGNTTEFQ